MPPLQWSPSFRHLQGEFGASAGLFAGSAALVPVTRPLSRPLDPLVLRYLGAFGPASARDLQTWSGLNRLQDVLRGLGARLRRFRDMAGRELFDLPEAPRPDPATPAPPRFLPEYDNLFFGYHDRTRIWSTGQLVPLPPGNGGRRGTLLVDGLFQGTWAVTSAGPRAVLEVTPFQPFSRRHAQSVIAEGHRLLSFVAPDCADAAVVFTPM